MRTFKIRDGRRVPFEATICRCDEDGRPAGQHSPDCPYANDLYAEALKRLILAPQTPGEK